MAKRVVLWVLVVAVVAGTGWVFYQPGQAEAGPELALALVSRGDVVDTVQATGTLEAVTTVQVGTQVSGTVMALHADFNSVVRKGQVVAELEPSLFETQVEQAKATLVKLGADLDRSRVQVEDSELKRKRAADLFGRKLIPASELETAEANARQAQASLKAAEAQIVQAQASLNQNEVNLGHSVIRAPIDGVVISRDVDVGQTVAASMSAPTLFVIARDLTEMQVGAAIDESDIGRIQPGQAVTFRVDAYPDDTFTGRVSQVRLQPVVVQNVVSYTTIIDVPNPEMKLKPGMTATVTVEIARANNVLRVPNGALRFRPTPDVFAALGQADPQAPALAANAVDASSGNAGSASRHEGAEGAAPAALMPEGLPPGMQERLAQMPPEERAQMQERMQQRGGPGAGGPGGPGMRERLAQMSPEERAQMRERMQQQGGRGEGGVGGMRGAGGFRGPASPATGRAAAPRQVWLLADGRLQQVTVLAGISSGAMTAILEGPLVEGTQVATGVTQPTVASTGGGSPFFPSFGGFGGGGRGFGGGGRR